MPSITWNHDAYPLRLVRRAATAVAGSLALFVFTAAGAQAPKAPPAGSAVATFAGGCFWCMEPPYDKLDGVISTTSGYMGGTVKNPTYEQVSSGSTGHAEVVQVVYDPKKVSYEKLLEVFWKNIDPTVKDRQFCDVGTQYRTAIFVHTDEQRAAAEKSKALLATTKPFKDPHRDAHGRGDGVLAGRGLPPGLLHQESDPLQLLSDRVRPRRAPEVAVGQPMPK